MKKGFTMIEILAVFTVTAIILLISVPLVTGMLKKGNDSEFESFKDTVFIATEAYINDGSLIEVNNTEEEPATITIGELISSGYLKSTVKNPHNKKSVLEPVNQKIIIKVWRDEDNVLNYEIEED